MPDNYITNLLHFLDESGQLPDELPNPARRLALFQGAIVAWVTAAGAAIPDRSFTNVSCRRGHVRRPCFGTIIATSDPRTASIAWQCPDCGEQGQISGWEGTLWDRRRPDA